MSTLETLVAIASEAADVVMDVYETQFAVEYKAPADPVTEADRRANELICRRLAQEFPGVPVVAEESDPETFRGFRSSERIFFVDPVDGTAEFVKRNGEFAIMIGLIEGDRPTCGVVHAPAIGLVYGGTVGDGAWRTEARGPRVQIRPSATDELSRATLVASRSHRNENLEKAIEVLGVMGCIILGGAGLKGAAVAEARAEAYVAPGRAGQRWDSCAAEAILAAAGGRLTDAYGVPLDYRSEDLANDRGVVASNGLLHDVIVQRLDELRKTRNLDE